MFSHFITAWRVMKQGLTNFFRNTWLSIAATAVMFITLTIMLSSVIINMTLSKEIDNIVKGITVSVYFKVEPNQEQRQKLEDALKKQSNVRDVTYISQEKALRIFSEDNKDQPELLEGLTIAENALPASFEVQMYDLSKIEPIVKTAEAKEFDDFVDETSYKKDSQERIKTIANMQRLITNASIVAGVTFAVISVLIILNTIRMAIFTRGDEIRIMKLIGATNAYIRGPFLFEASLYGVVAAAMSLIIVYIALFSLSPELSGYFDSNTFTSVMSFFTEQWYVVVGGTLLTGVMIGIISSLLAMMRYLKL